MNYRNLIVFGSTSAIAKLCIPYLDFDQERIFSFDRMNSKLTKDSFVLKENRFEIDFSQEEIFDSVINAKLRELTSSPCVILNFMGVFGEIQPVSSLDIKMVLSENNENLLPFLSIAKMVRNFPSGTSVISFSGAGVGGENIDDSSLGYLSAKASMSILVEAIDRQLAPAGIRFGLVAPGAFPSPMQNKVAEANEFKIPNERIQMARDVMNSTPNAEKLIRLLKFLINNPFELGGRTWSANFDELTEKNGNFGKLRRMY
jgi:NAD(P)-dependent dehydrogenase (short-subunit alcohol dehydrogenase family)